MVDGEQDIHMAKDHHVTRRIGKGTLEKLGHHLNTVPTLASLMPRQHCPVM